MAAPWILIPNQNGMRWLPACLGSLAATLPPEVTVCVIDNGSQDGSCEFLRREFPQVKLLELELNLGFVQATNLGILAAKRANAEAALLLNNDTRVSGDWYARLKATADANPDYGILSPWQNDFEGNASPRTKAIVGDVARETAPEVVATDWVEGSCFWIKRAVLEQVGYLDPLFAPAYFEEMDFCRRAGRAGFKVGVATRSVIEHHGAGTSMAGEARSRQRVLCERNYLLYHAAGAVGGFAPALRTLVGKTLRHGLKKWRAGELSLAEWAKAMTGIPGRWQGIRAKAARDGRNWPCTILGDQSPSTPEHRYYARTAARLEAGGLPALA